MNMQTAHIRSIAVVAAGTNEEYQSSVLSGIADETKAQQINAACFVSFGGVLGNTLSDAGENIIYQLADFRQFDGAVLMTNTIMDPLARAEITEAVMALFDRIADPKLLVRRLNITANNVLAESEAQLHDGGEQMDLFSAAPAEERTPAPKDPQRERRRQETVLAIRERYGKNAILKGMNLEEGATARDRNRQIGGHRA